MKRFISIFLVFVLMIFGYIYSSRNLNSCLCDAGIEYEIKQVDADSEVLVFSGELYKDIIDKLGVEIVSIKDIYGRKIVEGYSAKLSKFKVINERKVNIQMSLFDDKLIVGYPLIKNSF